MGRVKAADVECRISLGIAFGLRLRECICERQAMVGHARQDVIAGAVEDAINAGDAVASQRLAHGLDDWNAAGHRRFEIQRDRVLFRHSRQFDAMPGEQRLVRRDHMLLGMQRRLDRCLRRPVRAADQLDEHVDTRVGRQPNRIVDPAHAGERHAAILVARASGHSRHPERPTGVSRQPFAMFVQQLQQPDTNRAKPRDAEFQWLIHELAFFAMGNTLCRLSGGVARNFLMLRAACRMRISFSTRAMRT